MIIKNTLCIKLNNDQIFTLVSAILIRINRVCVNLNPIKAKSVKGRREDFVILPTLLKDFEFSKNVLLQCTLSIRTNPIGILNGLKSTFFRS